jgi:hypothetical protein
MDATGDDLGLIDDKSKITVTSRNSPVSDRGRLPRATTMHGQR